MPRLAQLLGLTLVPFMFVAGGCSSDCKSPFDCESNEVCYQGTCRNALNEFLLCTQDIDESDTVRNGCGPAAMGGGPQPYICVSGRCQANPARGNVGPMIPDVGPAMDAMALDASGMDSTTGMDAGAAEVGAMDAGVTVSMCTVAPGPLNNTEDQDAPTAFAFTIDNNAPTAGQTVNISFNIAESCGLESATIIIEGDRVGMDPQDRITLQGTIDNASSPPRVTAALAISDCFTAVPHRVSSILLRDFAGNTANYLAVANQMNYQLSSNGAAAVDSGAAVIQFTPATSGQLPPGLTAITATPNATGFAVDVTVSQNAACGLAEMTVAATSTRGHTLSRTFNTNTGTFDVPACARSGTWTVSSLSFTDASRRTVSYFGASGAMYLRNDGVNSMVNVVSPALAGGMGDAQSPTLRSVPRTRRDMPMGGAGFQVDVVARDDACAIASGSATFSRNGRAFSTSLAAVGTEGHVAGCVAIPQCAINGAYTLSTMSVVDEGGASTLLTVTGAAYTLIESDGTASSSVPPSLIMITK